MRWKDIPGFDGKYQASEAGDVRNSFTGRVLAQRVSRYGYYQVNLSHGDKAYTAEVHRLVALAFMENLEGLPQVNHRNENKKDNRASNLEWCTSEYNLAYGTRIQRLQEQAASKWGKPVRQMSGEEELATYASIGEAARATGLKATRISRACHGERGSYAGFRWSFC